MTLTTEIEVTKPRRRWEPPSDLEVLPHSPELYEFRERRDRAQAAFDEQQADISDLVRQRDELERRVLEGDDGAAQALQVLAVRIARAPEAVAAAADELAGATIGWARFVEQAASDAQADARDAERALNRANGLHRRHLHRGTGEIPGAREELEQALAESAPLRQRQRDASRLKADAPAQLRRLISPSGSGRLGHNEIALARQHFVERVREEAAQATKR
jgi:hypothetical protein